MKILQITPFFYPGLAGMETFSLNLSRSLSQRGHQVDVLTINTHSAIKKEIIAPKIKVYRCSPSFRYRSLFVSLEFATKMIRAKDYDLYHIHIPFVFGLETAIAAAIVNHIPLVATHHGEGTMGVPGIVYSVMAKMYRLYGRFSRSISMRYVNRLIFLSPSYPQSLRLSTKMKEKIRIVRPGVDLQRFSPSSEGPNLRSMYGFDGNDRILLFVGALDKSHRYKGVDYLIEAVHLARTENNNIKLVIVGGGEMIPQLKRLVAESDQGQHVIFTGAVPNEQLPPYYAMCDIFVLPSLPGGPESFPTVLGEAMAMGKPCIASDMPGVRDALSNGYTGLLTPPKDSQALAHAILRLAEDDSLRNEMSRNARTEVEDHSWEKCAEETEAVYSELVMFKEEQNAG